MNRDPARRDPMLPEPPGRDPMHRQRSRVVFGIFIVAVGVFALLDNLHLFDSHLVQPFWPLVFVALGALQLSRRGHPRHWLLGVALVVVGAGMTLQNLGIFHFQVRDLWPLVLIWLGLNVIAKGIVFRAGGEVGGTPGRRVELVEHGARIDASATMSGIVLKNDSQEFAGGEINAVMGAVEVDLRQAAIAGEAVLHLSVIMGGVEIRVPREWSVVVNGSPLLGGIEDKTVPPMAPGKRLVIEGSVIMGGVEISN
jgi:predicted membrane protein